MPPDKTDVVDLSRDDDDLPLAGPGPSTAAGRARNRRRQRPIEVVDLLDSSDDEELLQPRRARAGSRDRAAAAGPSRMLSRFSSVEIVDDDDRAGHQQRIAPSASPPPQAAPAARASVSSAGGPSSRRRKTGGRPLPTRRSRTPAAEAGLPEAPRAVPAEVPVGVPIADDAPAELSPAEQAAFVPPDAPRAASASVEGPGEAAVELLEPILVDLALILPELSAARVRAVVEPLWDEGLRDRAAIVDRAMDVLMADPVAEVEAHSPGGSDDDTEEDEGASDEAVADAPEPAAEDAAGSDVGADPPPAPPSPGSDSATQLVLMLPDIDPAFARQTVDDLLAKGFTSSGRILDQAMDVLFALPKGYPKAAGSGKRKRAASEEPGDGFEGDASKKARVVVDRTDYGDARRQRGLASFAEGKVYDELSVAALSEGFGLVPVPHLRKEFAKTHLFAPTYLSIFKQSKMAEKPYKEKRTPTFTKGKDRRGVCAEWERESQWLRKKLADGAAQRLRELAEAEEERRLEESGLGLECGCCFGTVAFERCGACDEGHLFCVDCIGGHAKNQIGSQIVEINCMDTSGCQASFHESELRRVLPAQLIGLWERLQQQKQIAAAGLANLVACPFCDFAVEIDNPDEKLFRCQGAECGVISCRKCQREEHLPRTCEEVAAEDKLDHRHAVEEAMTQALIRKCPLPTCGKPTTKESGCNKMSCTSCRTMFCYLCLAIIKDYNHFDQSPANYSLPKDKAKCVLWDDLGDRTEKELLEAREKAKAELRAKGIEVDDSMDVALPHRAPKPAAQVARPAVAHPYGNLAAAAPARYFGFRGLHPAPAPAALAAFGLAAGALGAHVPGGPAHQPPAPVPNDAGGLAARYLAAANLPARPAPAFALPARPAAPLPRRGPAAKGAR